MGEGARGRKRGERGGGVPDKGVVGHGKVEPFSGDKNLKNAERK